MAEHMSEQAKPTTEKGENSIEITPEMMEAGAGVLFAFETETADEWYWAHKVYAAMEAKRRRRSP